MSNIIDLQAVMAELAALKSENTRLKTNKSTSNGVKLSEKGCISKYGIRRMGIHFYAIEWLKLALSMPDVLKFISENSDKVSVKDQEEFKALFQKVAEMYGSKAA